MNREVKESAGRRVRISVQCDGTKVKVPVKKVRQLAEFLFGRITETAPALVWDGISVLLTDDAGIVPFKQSYFGRNEVTDVISFRYESESADAPVYTGELVVNTQEAERSCKLGRWDAGRELALYIAHGFDHLTGADDNTPAKRRRMRQRELKWLEQADRAGLLTNLLPAACRKAQGKN